MKFRLYAATATALVGANCVGPAFAEDMPILIYIFQGASRHFEHKTEASPAAPTPKAGGTTTPAERPDRPRSGVVQPRPGNVDTPPAQSSQVETSSPPTAGATPTERSSLPLPPWFTRKNSQDSIKEAMAYAMDNPPPHRSYARDVEIAPAKGRDASLPGNTSPDKPAGAELSCNAANVYLMGAAVLSSDNAKVVSREGRPSAPYWRVASAAGRAAGSLRVGTGVVRLPQVKNARKSRFVCVVLTDTNHEPQKYVFMLKNNVQGEAPDLADRVKAGTLNAWDEFTGSISFSRLDLRR